LILGFGFFVSDVTRKVGLGYFNSCHLAWGLTARCKFFAQVFIGNMARIWIFLSLWSTF